MLVLLHIENIAVIESADIQFDRGFNALTGETGAGKSIVVDAIGAVLGERTSRDLIRTGARSALVSAEFTALPALPWFAGNGLGPDGEGSLLLQREIQADGKNVCRLNGRPLTVSQLRALGRQLLNIHGQHDGQQLLDPACHLDYLDRFGGTGEALSAFQRAYEAMSAIRREMAALQMDEAEKARRADSLAFQIGELERAELQPGEEEALLERRNVLRNAEKLLSAVEGARLALSRLPAPSDRAMHDKIPTPVAPSGPLTSQVTEAVNPTEAEAVAARGVYVHGGRYACAAQRRVVRQPVGQGRHGTVVAGHDDEGRGRLVAAHLLVVGKLVDKGLVGSAVAQEAHHRAFVCDALVHRDDGIEQYLEVGARVDGCMCGSGRRQVASGRESHDAHVVWIHLPCLCAVAHGAYGVLCVRHGQRAVALGHAVG